MQKICLRRGHIVVATYLQVVKKKLGRKSKAELLEIAKKENSSPDHDLTATTPTEDSQAPDDEGDFKDETVT